MTASGPLGRHAVETGLVIAGTDAIAADVVGTKLLEFNLQAYVISGKRGSSDWMRPTQRRWSSQ